MVKKISKSMQQDYDVFLTKVQAICKKSPLTVRYVTKVRGSNDEVVIKVNDDVEVSLHRMHYSLIFNPLKKLRPSSKNNR